MRDFFTSRAFAVLILVVLLCMGSVLYTGTSGDSNPVSGVLRVAVAPLHKGFSWLTGSITHGIAYFTDYDAIKAENEELRKKLREAELQLRDAQIALDENDRLRSLAGIKERNRSFEFEVAEVIAHSVGDWQSSLTLDKGSMHDVQEGDLVITEDGMVGFVAVVAPNYCEVTTVIDRPRGGADCSQRAS